MQKSRRTLVAWLGLIGVLGALLGPAAAFADPVSAWTAGPGAILDPTYDGFIDIPKLNSTVPTGSFTVAGWFVDKTAEGWAGADDLQIWQGTMDGGGKMLTKAIFAQGRPDVAAATGNPYWAASGFGGVVPAGALAAGVQTLSVYAHTPGKGWWYKQVNVTASASAPASAAPAPSATTPTVSGGALPVLVIEKPTSGENINTHDLWPAVRQLRLAADLQADQSPLRCAHRVRVRPLGGDGQGRPRNGRDEHRRKVGVDK
jgi:hypothetical protein